MWQIHTFDNDGGPVESSPIFETRRDMEDWLKVNPMKGDYAQIFEGEVLNDEVDLPGEPEIIYVVHYHTSSRHVHVAFKYREHAEKMARESGLGDLNVVHELPLFPGEYR